MKIWSFLFVFLCLMFLAVASVATVPSKMLASVIDLSGDWDFTYTNSHTEHVPDSNTFEAAMPVPGCWDDYLDRLRPHRFWSQADFNSVNVVEYPMKNKPPDGGLPYLLGTGWYRKQIDVPADWKSRQITLHVGRVVMEAWVYVNGQEVHHHVGHSTTWQVPLGPHLNFGQTNELVIAVDNTNKDRVGCIIRGWKGRSTGIFGPVKLKVAGSMRIADLYIFPQDDKLNWWVELQGTKPANSELRWVVHDQDSEKVLAKGSQQVGGTTVQWTTGTLGMKQWSDRQPNLYKIEISLWSERTCLDIHRQRFGLRRLTTDGFSLRLNDKPIYLRGVCEHAYYPETCTPPTEIEWYRRHIRRLKQLGFNWLRFHTSVPLEPYIQAADELGMLIQVESPLGFQEAQWVDILRFGRKHPSVVIYCCGNEEVLDEPTIAFIHKYERKLRQIAPDALFNPQEGLRGVEYGTPEQLGKDVVKEPFLHNAQRLEQLKSFSDVFGQYAWEMLSYSSLRGDARQINDRLIVYERPCLSHELGIIGCYLNLDLEHRYVGSRIGTSLFANIRRNLASAGLLDKASLYYRSSSAWQRLLRKDTIETARKVPRLAGYDLLGANDAHWHRIGYGCGLMNEFDELKPGDSVRDVLSYNGESVLLLDEHRMRNLRAGVSFNNDLLISWFGDGVLRGATVRWYLQAEDGSVLRRGERTIKPIEPGRLEKIMTIAFTVPKITQPIKTRLEVQLSAPGCELDNRWNYWIFPNIPVKNEPSVTVVSELNSETLQELMRGGRVVLLGHKPLPARETSFQMALSGRPFGNLATVIADHPLTNRFPHDGYCDWQFYPMIDGAVAVVFDDMVDAFDPILEVVSSYKLISKQASLFEWQVGNGRLLVCTLNLPESDPAAVYLRRCLLDYAASGEFEPRTHLSPHELAKRLKMTLPGLEKQQDTDKAADPRVSK